MLLEKNTIAAVANLTHNTFFSNLQNENETKTVFYVCFVASLDMSIDNISSSGLRGIMTPAEMKKIVAVNFFTNLKFHFLKM